MSKHNRTRSKPDKLWPAKDAGVQLAAQGIADAVAASPEITGVVTVAAPGTDVIATATARADDRDDQSPPVCSDDDVSHMEFMRRLAAMQTTRSVSRAIIVDADEEKPTRPQLAKMLGRYRDVTDGRLHYANLEPGIDKLRRAVELIDAAEMALRDDRYADARQLVGLVQGILYALGIHTWEYIASDEER